MVVCDVPSVAGKALITPFLNVCRQQCYQTIYFYWVSLDVWGMEKETIVFNILSWYRVKKMKKSCYFPVEKIFICRN